MQSSSKNFEEAKQAAQRLFKRVNFEGGNLQSYELNSLLQQTYQILNIPYKPTSEDVKQYSRVLDANGDGAVSLQDLQTMAVNYLCGDGVLGDNKLMGSATSLRVKSSNYTEKQNHPKQDTPNYNNFQQNNNYDNHQQSNSYESYQKGSKQAFEMRGYQNNLKGFNNNYQKNVTTSYQGSSGNYQSRLPQNSYEQPRNLQQMQYQNNSTGSKYTPEALSYLKITRELFKKHANTQSQTITRDRVAALLNETYAALGRKGYHPNEEDVNVWMKLCDTNSDGHVEEAEYEYFVVRALERSGVKVNNQ